VPSPPLSTRPIAVSRSQLHLGRRPPVEALPDVFLVECIHAKQLHKVVDKASPKIDERKLCCTSVCGGCKTW